MGKTEWKNASIKKSTSQVGKKEGRVLFQTGKGQAFKINL